MEIDRASSVPPYQQIAGWLRERIAGGELEPGARLPSALDLSQEYGVAIMTARKALGVIVGEGLAYRSVGLGTYVTQARRPPR